MRFLLLAFLLFVSGLSVVLASVPAQEQPVYCDKESIELILTSVSELLTSVDERIDTDTPDALLADLRTAHGMMLQVANGCFAATPTPQNVTYIVAGNQGVNARSCPSTTCNIVSTLSPGTEVQSLGTFSGDTVSGSSEWYQINVSGQMAFVHSSLVSQERPASS
jgi:hypothetical protein